MSEQTPYFHNDAEVADYIEQALDLQACETGHSVSTHVREGFHEYHVEFIDQVTGVEYQITIKRASNAKNGVEACPECSYYVTKEDREEMEAHIRSEHTWDQEMIDEYFGTDGE
jgi:hypothetical protein